MESKNELILNNENFATFLGNIYFHIKFAIWNGSTVCLHYL